MIFLYSLLGAALVLTIIAFIGAIALLWDLVLTEIMVHKFQITEWEERESEYRARKKFDETQREKIAKRKKKKSDKRS